MPKRIPIAAAKRIATDHDLRQVILVAWDGKLMHVVTYGKSVEDCDQAAQGGNRVKAALGWPEILCREEPSRVMKIRAALNRRTRLLQTIASGMRSRPDADPYLRSIEAELYGRET
jgi:hypothetical protein